MKFGGLSEKEVEKISDLLGSENIPFSVDKDEEIEEFNTTSMENNLRHYAPPNISTNILAITIEDEDFHRISDSGKAKLLDFGITDQAPAPEDFKPFTGESNVHQELAEGSKRMVAFNLKHQIITGIIFLVIVYMLRNLL